MTLWQDGQGDRRDGRATVRFRIGTAPNFDGSAAVQSLPGTPGLSDRVRRVGLAEIALELAEEGVATGEVRRGDPVASTERVGEVFGSRLRVGLGHTEIPDCGVVGPARERRGSPVA
jgi:hypothetical protein